MNAQQLRDKYEQDLAQLQETCEHEKAEWMEHHFAPGHFDGMVFVCANCDKILKKETHWRP